MKKLTIAAVLVAGASTLAFAAIAAPQGHKGPGNMMLEEVDANQDGNITQAEIDAHRAAKKAEMFAAADTNGDNLVTFAEFDAHAEAEKARREAERRQRHFEMLDADSDGFVTAAEMEAAEGRRGRRGGSMFDRLDADGDGVLTEAEREAAKAKWAERRENGEGRRGMRRGGR